MLKNFAHYHCINFLRRNITEAVGLLEDDT
ncbi:hypothetical protein BXY53_1132 [Dichotomicrobium thermohalophilum]|uniref:Uncharacterized protein n=1 Tax=Dichotomicrobium thermohalophilum TaxID=933063 RepID=A0A397Q4R7_9HYPH|nr:hypothetical protein BXY53_1132 [Dichotomicrobium thermohalophilum]